MANDVADSITDNLLSLPAEHEHYLAQIRHWENLRLATEGEVIWIKGFTQQQWHAQETMSMPFALRFHVKDQLLFPEGASLPLRKAPAFLWTPVQSALPVTLPSLNHNYFGLKQMIDVVLLTSDQEEEIVASVVTVAVLRSYMEQAPAVRVKNLCWCLFSEGWVLLLGQPLLPIKSTNYWCRQNALLPAGYDFEFPILSGAINRKINPGNDCWIFWNVDGTYHLIPKDSVKELSLSSFRRTLEQQQSK